MSVEIRLPKLSQSMEEGTVARCLVNVGDKVIAGQVIFEIETDKAAVEMECPDSGYVKAIIAGPGTTVPAESVLMIIGEQNETIGEDYVNRLKAAAEKNTGIYQNSESKSSADTIVSPDIFSSEISHQPALGATVPLSRLQKITGKRMLESKQNIPCFYLTVNADATELVEYRSRLNDKSEIKVSYNDIIIKAMATAITSYPLMAGHIDGDEIKISSHIGVGIAVVVPDGLVAPIVRDVQDKTIFEVAEYSRNLVERAKAGKLNPADFEGGVTAISNLGSYGIDSFVPIVVPGQCSILGIGRIIDTPVPERQGVVVRKMMAMTLSVDHRIANGAYAAQYLDALKKIIENPGSGCIS